MFKIGDFSKVCQVSIKALRHWDDIGLLKPAYTDPATSYRYYSIEQLKQVNRIQALRDLGLSLKQTADLLAEELPVSEMRGMLRLKQSEFQQQIEDAQARLAKIEARLQQIEQEGRLPDYETRLKVIEPQRVYGVRLVTADFAALVNLILQVYRVRDQVTARAASPVTAVFHDPGFDDADIDIELAFHAPDRERKPLPLAAAQTLTIGELPGVELMACTVHRGRWLTLSNGYTSLGR